MTIDIKRRQELRGRARLMEPHARIGKNGLTDPVVAQVRRMFNTRELVKVKLLRSFMESNDRKKAALELAKKTGAELVDQVGFVVVLFRKKESNDPARTHVKKETKKPGPIRKAKRSRTRR